LGFAFAVLDGFFIAIFFSPFGLSMS